MAKKKATKKGSKKATKKAVKKTAKKAARKKTVKKKVSKKPASKKASPKKASPKMGEAVKDFSLPVTGGKEFRLSGQKGKALVLYFYPKDATPGCTLEGQDFTRLHEEFKKAGADVFGISRDSLKSHENFKAKENYSMELLSDEEEKVCRLFDVIKEKNMYGRKVMGIERSTFVIDKDGKLVKEWRGVKVPGHAEEVLDFIQSL
jgi:peroxiredoxin Q/BCP